MSKEKIVCDLEVYPNYFLAGFKRLSDGKKVKIEVIGESSKMTQKQSASLLGILNKYTTITFNGMNYDFPVMCKIMDCESSCYDIFKMSERVVKEGISRYKVAKMFGIQIDMNRFDHIDIQEPAPGVFVSLKGYGARLHSKRLQDLPYPYDTVLDDFQIEVVRNYNINDLDTTIDLYNDIKDRIDLRYEMSKKYGEDLRSKSDAQIAETVIVSELQKARIDVPWSIEPPKYVMYKAPACVEFQSYELQDILERVQKEKFVINQKNGSPKLPDWLAKGAITIGKTKYQIGIGGLHSKEKKLVCKPKDGYVMRNADVASYYPSMIMEFGFYPKRFTKKFLDIYGDIKKTRLAAKASGDKVVNESLKIVLNGSFGKLGSMYSKLYAPDLMLQVTITGQLMLLMLIERMEEAGFEVVSSNTDGIEYICHEDDVAKAEAIIFDWELDTGMEMEHGQYKALYARDVNNYVAIYDEKPKAKGVYAPPTLQKNSEYPIVFEAIREYLHKGTPMEKTIDDCEDIRQFLTARTVKGGGVWKDEYLGKVVRWYYSENGDSIHYQTNGNKVPKSDGAHPMMELHGHIPNDLDYAKYYELAIKHLNELGVEYEPEDNYECVRCDYVGRLDTFSDTEYDGDVIGTCPNCGKNGVILPEQMIEEKI